MWLCTSNPRSFLQIGKVAQIAVKNQLYYDIRHDIKAEDASDNRKAYQTLMQYFAVSTTGGEREVDYLHNI